MINHNPWLRKEVIDYVLLGFDRQTHDSKNKDNSRSADDSPSDKLKTLWQLTDMGFKVEDSKRAMQILKCTDLHTLMDYLFSLSTYF